MKAVKITSADRADVLKATWALVKKSGFSFASALRKAWAAIKIKVSLGQKLTSFQYQKDDGSERHAVGFNRVAPTVTPSDKPAIQNPLVIKYYDLACDGWRSFRIDRLITE